jgi:hypothetical protein
MTPKEKMEQARSLIQIGRFDEARDLLRTVDHPTAQKWLDKIDELDPPAAKSTPPAQSRSTTDDEFFFGGGGGSAKSGPPADSGNLYTPLPPKPGPSSGSTGGGINPGAILLGLGLLPLAVIGFFVVACLCLCIVLALLPGGSSTSSTGGTGVEDVFADDVFANAQRRGTAQLGQTVRGTISDANEDGDMWTFRITQVKPFTITFKADGGNFDEEIYLYNPAGVVVAVENDLFDESTDGLVYTFTPRGTGEFQVAVKEWGVFVADGGGYTLVITQ